jgi:hypothetical protein
LLIQGGVTNRDELERWLRVGYERGKVLARRGMVLEAFLGLSDTDWLAFTAIFTAFSGVWPSWRPSTQPGS